MSSPWCHTRNSELQGGQGEEVARVVGMGRDAWNAAGSAAPRRALETGPWLVRRLDQRCNVQAQAAGPQGSAPGQRPLLGCGLGSGRLPSATG